MDSNVRMLGELLDMFLLLLSVALMLITFLDPYAPVLWSLVGLLSALVVARMVLAFTWERELEGKRRP